MTEDERLFQEIEKMRQMLRQFNAGEIVLFPPHLTAIYDLLKACETRIKQLKHSRNLDQAFD